MPINDLTNPIHLPNGIDTANDNPIAKAEKIVVTGTGKTVTEELATKIASSVNTGNLNVKVSNIWKGDLVEFSAIGEKDVETLYIVTDAGIYAGSNQISEMHTLGIQESSATNVTVPITTNFLVLNGTANQTINLPNVSPQAVGYEVTIMNFGTGSAIMSSSFRDSTGTFFGLTVPTGQAVTLVDDGEHFNVNYHLSRAERDRLSRKLDRATEVTTEDTIANSPNNYTGTTSTSFLVLGVHINVIDGLNYYYFTYAVGDSAQLNFFDPLSIEGNYVTLTNSTGGTLVIKDLANHRHIPVNSNISAYLVSGTESVNGTEFLSLDETYTVSITQPGELVPFLHKIGEGIDFDTTIEIDRKLALIPSETPDRVGPRVFLHTLSAGVQWEVTSTSGPSLSINTGLPYNLVVGSYLDNTPRYRVNSILNVGGNSETYTVTVLDTDTNGVLVNTGSVYSHGQFITNYNEGGLARTTADVSLTRSSLTFSRAGFVPLIINDMSELGQMKIHQFNDLALSTHMLTTNGQNITLTNYNVRGHVTVCQDLNCSLTLPPVLSAPSASASHRFSIINAGPNILRLYPDTGDFAQGISYIDIDPNSSVEVAAIRSAVANVWAIKSNGSVAYQSNPLTIMNADSAASLFTMPTNPPLTHPDLWERDAANPTRLIFKVAGTYDVEVGGKFRHGATGATGTIFYPIMRMLRNGVIVANKSNANTKTGDLDSYLDIDTHVTVAANDYLEFQGEALFAGSGSWLSTVINIEHDY